MKKAVFFKAFLVAGALVFLVGLSGCSSLSSKNNYLRPVDFARHLDSEGVKVASVRQLDPRPLSAGEAIELKVGNSWIGVYKYDVNHRDQRRRLEMIQKSKRVYFNGIPYPIYEVSGSFIVVGLDKNKEKRRILQALKSF